MFTQIAGIVLLAVMFIIATALPINMGALALVAAFTIGLPSHLAAKDIFGGFPGDLFVTLVGITYLFASAQTTERFGAVPCQLLLQSLRRTFDLRILGPTPDIAQDKRRRRDSGRR